jgi:hypothetical protein
MRKKMNSFNLTKLSKEQLNTLIKWAAEEGWNPGPGRCRCLLAN